MRFSAFGIDYLHWSHVALKVLSTRCWWALDRGVPVWSERIFSRRMQRYSRMQGKALNDNADKSVKVLVVGNPANTNALIAQRNAPDLDPRFYRDDKVGSQSGYGPVGSETNSPVSTIEGMCIWGNHSATQYPDLHGVAVSGKNAMDLVDMGWYADEFVTVQQRARRNRCSRASSAASAANAAIDHMRDWTHGNSATVSMESITMAVMELKKV